MDGRKPRNRWVDEMFARIEKSQQMLELSQASLTASQAALVEMNRQRDQEISSFRREMAEISQRTDERLTHIEAILASLPEVLAAIRDKIGFKPRR